MNVRSPTGKVHQVNHQYADGSVLTECHYMGDCGKFKLFPDVYWDDFTDDEVTCGNCLAELERQRKEIMIVCICNNITDKQIREAIYKHHCRTVVELHNILGVCVNCCKCRETIEEILEDDRQARFKRSRDELEATPSAQCD